MHYFFLEDQELTSGLKVNLAEADHNHAYRVLRLKQDEKVGLADGRGRAFIARVIAISSKGIELELSEEIPSAESPLKITLAQGLLKGDKMDQVVRQAVELGVNRIQPLITIRSIPHREHRQENKKLARWQNIARSAAAQCRRPYIPEVDKVLTLENWLSQKGREQIVVPWEEEKSLSFTRLLEAKPSTEAVAALIGPEGGFGKEEIELLSAQGAIAVSLGPRILRSETAAIAFITMLQSAWGDLT